VSGLSEIADVKGQLVETSYLPMKKVEKNITIHDTRKETKSWIAVQICLNDCFYKTSKRIK